MKLIYGSLLIGTGQSKAKTFFNYTSASQPVHHEVVKTESDFDGSKLSLKLYQRRRFYDNSVTNFSLMKKSELQSMPRTNKVGNH